MLQSSDQSKADGFVAKIRARHATARVSSEVFNSPDLMHRSVSRIDTMRCLKKTGHA
jgi:hypothetical protein